MSYTLIILVDGQRVSSNINASAEDVATLCELQGPDLWDFTTALKLTGKALDVRNDGYGAVVTIAHEEI